MAAENHGRNEVTMTEDRDGLIAVIGMAGRFPGADTLERFWENLVSGADVRTTFTDEELAGNGICVWSVVWRQSLVFTEGVNDGVTV